MLVIPSEMGLLPWPRSPIGNPPEVINRLYARAILKCKPYDGHVTVSSDTIEAVSYGIRIDPALPELVTVTGRLSRLP